MEVIVLMTRFSEPSVVYDDPISVAQMKALDAQIKPWNARIMLLADFAAQTAQNRISTTPLHIVEHLGKGNGWLHHYDELNAPRSGWAPTTYEVVYDDLDDGASWMILSTFYLIRRVVRFSTSCGYNSRRVKYLATAIYSSMNQITNPLSFGIGLGRLYLCGVPALVLSPNELLAAGNKANEVAKSKVFNAIPALVINYGIRPTWEAYNSRVHFVNLGFRPTLADLAED